MTIALLDRPALPVDDATRRQFLTGAAAAALLAGCSRADPAAPAPPAGNGFPVTIDHRYGSTEIPAEPRRIITVGLTDQDAVYALGKQPVAVTDWLTGGPSSPGPWKWHRARLREFSPWSSTSKPWSRRNLTSSSRSSPASPRRSTSALADCTDRSRCPRLR